MLKCKGKHGSNHVRSNIVNAGGSSNLPEADPFTLVSVTLTVLSKLPDRSTAHTSTCPSSSFTEYVVLSSPMVTPTIQGIEHSISSILPQHTDLPSLSIILMVVSLGESVTVESWLSNPVVARC